MQQLSPLDAWFLYAESTRTPMHVAALLVYDPSTAPSGKLDADAIVENIRRRAGRIDCFRRRLVSVPFQLDHPYWIEDAEFRPERHVRRVTLPEPGDWQALCELVGRLHGSPLARERPLWEMCLIEGLDRIEELTHGSYGVFLKLHHAAVDGIAGIGVTLALHDATADAEEPSPTTWRPEAHPSPTELLVRTQFRGLELQRRWFSALFEIPQSPTGAPPFAPAPRTRFERGVSARRVFASSRFPFEEVHAAERGVAGATVNDVVLTVVGGALRRYLLSKDELPERTLLAMAPISVRAPSDQGGGNQFTQMIVPLHTELGEPVERLRAVHTGTALAKARAKRETFNRQTRWSELQPAPWTAALAARFLPAEGTAVRFNAIVSDVPGPPVPLYSCGAELLRVYGAGPVWDGAGLFHTALSYGGDLTITTTSCPQLLPDSDFYHACLRSSYEELRAATL